MLKWAQLIKKTGSFGSWSWGLMLTGRRRLGEVTGEVKKVNTA